MSAVARRRSSSRGLTWLGVKSGYEMWRWMTFSICSLGWAPTSWSATWPPLKISSVGMPRILNLPAALMFSSTLSFTTFNFPACSFASSSTVGVNIWHGRHQSAQKSTITGWVLLASTTSASKFASFTAWMLSDMLSRLSLVAPHYASKSLRETFPALSLRCPNCPGDSCSLSCFIQCDISRRRSLPRKILGHAVLLHGLPCLLIALQFQCGPQRIQQRPPVIRLELKPSPVMRFRVVVLHRIVQPARGPHHRHGTIAQAVYLIQAARLVPRRHP